MKIITIRQTALSTALLLTALTYAQQPKGFGKSGFNPCSATQYESYLKTAKGKRTTDAQFENWLSPKIEQLRGKNFKPKSGNTVVTLPVVVHIIHNGDAIGENENITDEKVFSQIQVLNNDFRRLLGTPGYNENTPGNDIEIEFCLAQRDPQGNPTNGIDRVQKTKANWGMMAIETQLKPQTQWDPEKYINIWVCDFGSDLEGVGGYAFFPEASGLEGLEGVESYYENDGVTMYYKCFGSSDLADGEYIPGMDKGRALTHEMGHFFGLRHIWGDGEDCTATDYCDDTPTAIAMNTSCDYNDSCTLDEKPDMIENYMDYTPDECKSVFTANQKERIWAVMNNAQRRGTLITSDGCQAPTAGTDDHNLLQGLIIYPNPASEVLNITSDITGAAGSYEIYNTLGQTVAAKSITFEESQGVDISGLSQGVYIIKLTRDGKAKTLKFIKE